MALRAIPCAMRCGGGCGWWNTETGLIDGFDPELVRVWVARLRCSKCRKFTIFDARRAAKKLRKEI